MSGSSSRTTTWAAAGLGCLISWTYVVFLSWAVLTPSHGNTQLLDAAYPVSFIGLAAILLIGAAVGRTSLAWLKHLDETLSSGRSMRGIVRLDMTGLVLGLVAMLVACAGTVLLVMGERGQLGMGPYLGAAFLSGLGLGILYLLWAAAIARLPRRSVPVCVALAFVIGAAIYTIALHLPAAPTHVVAMALPAVSLVCLALGAPIGDTAQREPIPGLSPQMMPRIVGCFLLLSFVEGLSRSFFLQANEHADPVLHRWVFLIATIGACALLLVASLQSQGGVGITSTGRAGMLLLALMFLLTPIVEDLGLTADILTMVSHVLLLLIQWTMLTQVVNAYQLPPVRTLGLGLGLTYLGWAGGSILGNALSAYLRVSYHLESLLALACATLTMLAFFLIARDRSVAEVASDDEHASGPRRFMLRCEGVAQRYGLTKKETEVMVLVAKGRTAQRVQEIMGISAGTVNTHLSHIYRKLGVHSKQEMIDKLEE